MIRNYTYYYQGGICGEKQWGIYIKIEEKLSKNWGKIEEKLIFPQPLETNPCSPYKYVPPWLLSNLGHYQQLVPTLVIMIWKKNCQTVLKLIF